MRKKLIPLLLLAAIIFMITACPYASKVPIDEPSVKVNKELLGKWIKAGDQEKENPEFFVITGLNDYKYNIVKHEYNTYDSAYKEKIYISHISKIDNLSFMNMQQDGKGDYFLYKIVLSQGEFSLFEVTDNIDEKFNTSQELKAFIKKHMHLSFFYNKDEEKYIKNN
jgi:biopolymer transport protein ExbD